MDEHSIKSMFRCPFPWFGCHLTIFTRFQLNSYSWSPCWKTYLYQFSHDLDNCLFMKLIRPFPWIWGMLTFKQGIFHQIKDITTLILILGDQTNCRFGIAMFQNLFLPIFKLFPKVKFSWSKSIESWNLTSKSSNVPQIHHLEVKTF